MALGINCALKLRKIRKKYLKKKTSPFKKYSHIQNGMVVDVGSITARQPNSGKRNYVRVLLNQSKKKKTCYVPFCGGSSFVKVHDMVTVQSIGGSKGRAKGDMWGFNKMKRNFFKTEIFT